ncbi:MAG: tRNA 4-thiouridine(8) synthase ThiI, partial [Oscillospiraceae bacterium]|nr:tRNA 4-thiouridine(8) synthase ThiI [Oscillospiraceae bacterium]
MSIINYQLLLKPGELILKGGNRRFFEERLIGNLKVKLRTAGDFYVSAKQSTIYVEARSEAADMELAADLCCKTFGIVNVCKAVPCEKDKDAIARTAIDSLADIFGKISSFKVESKRSDKRFPLSSIELSQYVGGALNDAYPEVRVDVHNPEFCVNAEVRDSQAFIHGAPLPGSGGLPVGVSGRSVCLLSGGIDSPVALYKMAKRGLRVIPVHFNAPPYTSELAKEKVLDLCRVLLPYCEKLSLIVVNFTHVQEEIRRKCPEELFTVISRRFMTRIAESIAIRNGAGSLITGESLGQVASQTQEAIAVTENAVNLPVMRPLIGSDKSEIVEVARKIGTFDISSRPYEDCCTVFTPRHPKTKPKLAP